MASLARVRLLVVTLWAGSLWTVGYLVAPTLFATLSDRMLAGTIAGSVFNNQAWLSMACALVLLILLRWGADDLALRTRRLLSLLVLAMLACTLLMHFGVQPLMAALREAAGPGGVMGSSARGRFGILHGVSSAIYLLQSGLAVLLVARQ
jgi:predicted neutral ceramidase superfamily lipid hydrolase